jgi:acyl transferase domain-containing protein
VTTTGEDWTEGSIAIVGAACRFPGAPDLDAYWSVLRSGTDTISRFEPERLRAAGVPEDLLRDPSYVAAGGVLPGGELFDWTFFGYSKAEARTVDPQQRVLLECASQALDHAALDPARFDGWIGVFAGCDATASPHDFDDPAVMTRLVGTEKDFLATRIAYKLGLRGPALTLPSRPADGPCRRRTVPGGRGRWRECGRTGRRVSPGCAGLPGKRVRSGHRGARWP